MKKLLLCSTLIIALLLVGCNDNKVNENNNQENNNINQEQIQNQPEDQPEKDETPVVIYDSPDFTEKAGFKIAFGPSLTTVAYDSIFLINNSVAQLDLKFEDNSKGTMLIDPSESSHLFSPDDATFVGDIKVSIETGADGILVYEWRKDNYTFVYSTTSKLKDTQTLTDLVTDLSIQITKK